ncbi:hypothetical protein GCM10027073_21660 [Streptomyces chlorus]
MVLPSLATTVYPVRSGSCPWAGPGSGAYDQMLSVGTLLLVSLLVTIPERAGFALRLHPSPQQPTTRMERAHSAGEDTKPAQVQTCSESLIHRTCAD